MVRTGRPLSRLSWCFPCSIQKLHNQATNRAKSKGQPLPPELKLDHPPLAECAYYEVGTPINHGDETVVATKKNEHLDCWKGFRSQHYATDGA